jgi:RHS repeat-associated protein
VVNYAPGGTVNSSFSYSYNSLDEVATMTTVDGTWTYSYDLDGQLIHAAFASTNSSVPSQSQAYTYNAAGDRTSTVLNGVTTSYLSNSVNEYTSVGGVAYTYDVAGNLTSDGTNSYTYNVIGELTSVTTPTGTTQYNYDALGNRIMATAAGVTTDFLVDPTGLGAMGLGTTVGASADALAPPGANAGLGATVGEFTSGGNAIAENVYGLGLVSQVTPAGASYDSFDGQGSTADVTNGSGTVVDAYNYNPFGSFLTSSESASNPFAYLGQYGVSLDAGGLVQLGYRAYSTTTGQFAAFDPLGLGGGEINTRQYSYNDPTTLADPSGLAPQAYLTMGKFDADDPLNLWDDIQNQFGYGFGHTEFRFNDQAVGPPVRIGYDPSGLHPAVDPQIHHPIMGFDDPNRLRQAIKLTPPKPYFYFPTPWTDNCQTWANRVVKTYNNLPGGSSIPVKKSTDPNDLLGPSGYGPAEFITNSQSLNYTIQFQNEPAATAPAQEVVITEQLSPSLNWSTFQLGDFDFGNLVVPVPAGHTSYQTVVDATASVGLLVSVSADFNPVTGLVKWTFTSIDATTLDVPADPLAGFLPPDKTDPEGDGFVSYSVLPKASTQTGQTISAQASVVFDTNSPIATPTATNTIDSGTPSSSVFPLPATSGTTFTVSWSGSDAAGPGIAAYDVYVSDQGGPYTLWQSDTTATSAIFTGQSGHTYSFYSIARDPLGFVQATPTAAQASTFVPAPSPPTIIGEQVLFTRKPNKKHKPTGKPILSGFEIEYSSAMNASAAGNAANYQVDRASTKRVHRKKVTVLHRVPVTVNYNAMTNSASLRITGKQAFAQGGKMTVIAAPPGGVSSAAGVFLDGNNEGQAGDDGTFTISPGARKISRSS